MSDAAQVLHFIALAVASTLTPIALAQNPAPQVDPVTLTFEVSAVHPDSPNSMGGMTSVFWRDASYEASHVTLKELVREAYGVEDVQIQNDPRWMDSQAFTVEARIDTSAANIMKGFDDVELKNAQKHMLQSLLAEKFRLTITPNVKQLPIYEITFSKAVSNLRKANAGTRYEDGEKWGDGSLMGSHIVSYEFIDGHIRLKGQGASLDQLVDRLNQKLSSRLGRIFVDGTGLAGNFDFELSFTVPWHTVYGPIENSFSTNGSSEDSSDISLFSAFKEQLGLSVKSTKGPVNTLWIEHVEQPIEN